MDVKHHVYLLTFGTTELRSCVKVEVALLRSPSLKPVLKARRGSANSTKINLIYEISADFQCFSHRTASTDRIL